MKTDKKKVLRRDLKFTCAQIIERFVDKSDITIYDLVSSLGRPYSSIHNALEIMMKKNIIEKNIKFQSKGRPTNYYNLNRKSNWNEKLDIKSEGLTTKERKLYERIKEDIQIYREYVERIMQKKGRSIEIKEFQTATLGWTSKDPEKFVLQQLEFAISESFQNKKDPRRFIVLPIPLQKGSENYQNAQMIEGYRGHFSSIITNAGKTKNKDPQQEELANSLEFISKEEKEAILNQK
jgi:predicted transcriptional regulator